MNKLPVELKIGSFLVCVKQRLAEGGFGFVDLVYDASSKQEYVLKRAGIERPEIFEVVKKEINILQRFSGPHFVKLLASEVITVNRGKQEACLLLEFCPGGHLLDRLNSRNGNFLPPASLYRIFGQLLLALKPMHESNPPVTHRDLKLENILFGSDNNLRLCDFGSCVIGPVYIRTVEERATAEEIIGKETTQMYRSPEMVDLYMREVLTEKSDIWALGCILYTLCFLYHPFQDAGSLGILGARINIPENIPVASDVKTLLIRMLDVDPEARPSIAQLLLAFGAIAAEKPLPEFKIPQEAIDRRQQREITAKMREERNNKTAKKIAHRVVPLKPTGPLDCNSVAARRIAMKKGVIPQLQQVNLNSTSSTEPLFEADFSKSEQPIENAWDAFGTSSSSSKIDGHSNEQNQTGFHFDAFTANDFNSFPAPPVKPPKQQLNTQESDNLFIWIDPEDKPQNHTVSKNSSPIDNHANSPQSFDNFFEGDIKEFDAFDDPFKSSVSSQFSPPLLNFSTSSSAQPASQSQLLSSFTTNTLNNDGFLFDTNQPSLYSPPINSNSVHSSNRPHPFSHTQSLPTILPSHELDLLDTTPGPPVIDFLSGENINIPAASRQYDDDVLKLFDHPAQTSSSFSSKPLDFTSR